MFAVTWGEKTCYLVIATICFKHFLMVSVYSHFFFFLAKYFSVSCLTNNYRENLLRRYVPKSHLGIPSGLPQTHIFNRPWLGARGF